MCVNCSFKSFKVIINPIVQTYNVSYIGASSLPGACCLGMTIGMALGPLLVSKASLRRLTYIVSWIPAGCWLLMYFILDFTVLIISFLIMARFLKCYSHLLALLLFVVLDFVRENSGTKSRTRNLKRKKLQNIKNH